MGALCSIAYKVTGDGVEDAKAGIAMNTIENDINTIGTAENNSSSTYV